MRRHIHEQVMVITGASSGIGLATARAATRRGARVLLCSRNADDLARICEALRAEGGRCDWACADVSDVEQVRAVAQKAITSFGEFDVWINNAAVSMYGRVLEEPIEDQRRVFDVNVWGTFHGCRVALEHLRDKGGALINISDVSSERTMFLQGTYSASEHAIKAMTEALRMELEQDAIPVSVTLVRTAAVDTPFVRHARNHLGRAVGVTAPSYAPEVVARAVLRSIKHPRREVLVGGLVARPLLLLEKVAPSIADRVVQRLLSPVASGGGPAREPGDDGLYRPLPEGRERGPSGERQAVLRHSAWAAASLHPALAGMTVLGVGALLWRVSASSEGPRTTPPAARGRRPTGTGPAPRSRSPRSTAAASRSGGRWRSR